MPVTYYCTAAEVQNHTITDYILQVSWTDPTDINTRIVEAQSIIDSTLAAYYTVPFEKSTSTPPIINTICKWMTRYLILRDIMEEQVVKTEDSIRILANKWKKDAEQYMNKILGFDDKGKITLPMEIIDTSGVIIDRSRGRTIDSSTSGVGTIFTMKGEIDQSVDESHSEDPVVVEED